MYCRQAVEEIAAKRASRQLNVYQNTNRGMMTLHKSSKHSPTCTESAQLLKQFTRQQNYVRTLYILVPGVQRPLRSALQSRYTFVINSNVRNVGTIPKMMSRFGKFLRIRYLLLTGAITGGVVANQVCATNPYIYIYLYELFHEKTNIVDSDRYCSPPVDFLFQESLLYTPLSS